MNTLYKDSLVEMTDQEIVFHDYYFPFGNDKHVALSQIESVEARPPSLRNGKLRIWGTGGDLTWFPFDGKRPKRDRFFIASLRNKSWRIGFTVEDSKKMAEILRSQGLLKEAPSA